MDPATRTAALRELAAELDGIDVDAYRDAGREPLHPVLGAGSPEARVCFFGRDPGRDEIRHQRPFVGAGGQKLRRVLHEAVHGVAMPDFEASLEVERYAFWANTVPYKPVGNKAWSVRIRRSFYPLVADLLVHEWAGSDVITLGQNAFTWFGLGLDRDGRRAHDAFWARDDRFEASTEVPVIAPDGATKIVRVHPVPHPSPLNATWFKRFDGLLAARLAGLELTAASWRDRVGAC